MTEEFTVTQADLDVVLETVRREREVFRQEMTKKVLALVYAIEAYQKDPSAWGHLEMMMGEALRFAMNKDPLKVQEMLS